MEIMKTFFYDERTDEFVEGVMDGGNSVIVTQEPGDVLRYKVEIDDFGYVVAAFNRLMQRLVPTFIFPKTSPAPIPSKLIMQKRRYIFEVSWPSYAIQDSDIWEIEADSSGEAWAIAGFRMGRFIGSVPDGLKLIQDEAITSPAPIKSE